MEVYALLAPAVAAVDATRWEDAEDPEQLASLPCLFSCVIVESPGSRCHFWIPLPECELLFVVLHVLAHDCGCAAPVVTEAYPHLANVGRLVSMVLVVRR